MKLIYFPLLACCLVSTAQAGNDAPYATEAQQADWAQRRAEATAKQQEALKLKEEAERIYLQEEKACYKHFLVNRCRDGAHQEEIQRLKVARKVDIDGKAMERQVMKEELEAKDAYRLAESQARQAELKARESKSAEEKAKLHQQVNANQTDKLLQAEAGARKRMQEDAEHRQRLADHERQVAEKIEKARQKKARESQPGG